MNIPAFIILTSTMFISMIGFGFIVPLLPIYAVTFGASSLDLGLITAATSIASIIFLPIMGPLSDRFGRKPFLCFGLFILTLASFGFIWAQSTMQLVILRAIQGIGMSMHLPVAQAYLGDMTPEGQEGRWMGYFNSIMLAGLGAGPLVGGIMNDIMGINSVFIVSGLAILISFFATVFFLERSSRKYHQEGTRISWSVIRNSDVLGAVLLLQVSAGLLFGMSMTFLPILASNKLALSTSLIGLILAVRTPISMLQSYTGKFADTHNRKTQIIVGNLIAALAIGTMSLSTGFYSLLAAHSLLCLGLVFSQPASSAYVVEEGREIGMGVAMALFLMALQTGTGLGPIIIGWIMDNFGFDQGFIAAALFNLAGLSLFLWLIRAVPGKKPGNWER